MRYRNLAVALVAGALALTAACAPAENRNAAAPEPAANANTGEPAAPASFPPGSPQYIIANQPDYAATVNFTTGPTSWDVKVVKKGDRWRVEQPTPAVGQTVVFLRPGQPTLVLIPERKQYFELAAADETSLANPITRSLENLEKQGVKIEQVGTETVNGHPTTKYRASREGENAEILIYTAEDLQNLIVKLEGRRENVGFLANWSNVTLNPPDDALQPPDVSGWSKIDASAFGGAFGGGPAPSGAGAPAQGGGAPPPANRPRGGRRSSVRSAGRALFRKRPAREAGDRRLPTAWSGSRSMAGSRQAENPPTPKDPPLTTDD